MDQQPSFKAPWRAPPPWQFPIMLQLLILTFPPSGSRSRSIDGPAVQRLQEWMQQPSIAAENRGMDEGASS